MKEQKMTTPIFNGPEPTSPNSTSDSCKRFFDLIADFHTKQMNTITLNSNDPAFVHQVESLLQNQKEIILRFLNTNEIPTSIDSNLKELLLQIQKISPTYNCEQSVLETYILDMFSSYPFTLTSSHIQNLKRKLFDSENLSEE